MTLEEKAKNYAWNYPIPYSLYEKIGDKKKLLGDVLEQVYIAGATENGIVWHDLRKNPDDLPKRLKAVWVKTEYDDYCEGYWWPERNRWQDNDMDDGESIGDVIAWCEIPQFEEEEDA